MTRKPNRRKKSTQTPGHSLAATPRWHNWWSSQSLVRQHIASLLLLLVIAIGFLSPIHFSDKQILAGDTLSWRAMAQSMMEYEQETAETALWAGRAFAGMPGYMISPELSVPQIDTVMRALRKQAWPASHLMLLFAGMYLLAFYVTRDTLASVLGAVAYGLTSYMPVILVAGHNSKFIALAWAPWMLLAFIHAMRKATVVSALLFAIALAVNLRAGHVQITYYVTFAAGVWWLVEAVQSARSSTLSAFLKSSAMLALGSVLGLMMVAEPYLAHAELAPYTIRGSASGGAPGGMAWNYAMSWSQGIGEMLTLLISEAYGGASPSYWGPKVFTSGPHYLGPIVIALLILGIWKNRDRTSVALLTAIACMTVFALGENMAFVNRPMFDYFPMFSAFRVPETWLSVVAMLTALLAARGASMLGKSVGSGANFWKSPGLRSFAVVLVAVIGLIALGSSLLSFEKPLERERLFAQIQSQYPTVSASDVQIIAVINEEIGKRKADRVSSFNSDTKRAFLLIVLAISLVFGLYSRRIPYWVFAFAMVLLLVEDLGSIGHRYLNEDVLSSEKSVEEKIPQYPFDSFLIEQRDKAGGEGSFRVLSLEFGREPSVNARPSYFYESIGGYTGAKLRVFQDYLDHVLYSRAGGTLNQAALSMTNVKYVVASGPIPGFDVVFNDEQTGMVVLENPDVLERAYLVDQVSVLSSPEAVWQRLNEPDFDPSHESLIVSDPDGLSPRLSAPADSSSKSSVEVLYYTAQDMAFQVQSDRPRLLLVSEVYYRPGWVATVNGTSSSIYQANQLLRAVEVPAGESNVRLQFRPASYRYGRIIAGAGTIFTYGLLFFIGFSAWRRKKRAAIY